METRRIPDIVMDILKNYSTIDGGEKPLLAYIDEIMAAYSGMEKEFYELSLWQEDLKKDLRELKITMKQMREKDEE